MLSLPTKISLIYYAAFILFASMGLFSIYINPNENKNRLFFLVCLSSSIWSFSLAMMTSAYTKNSALFWMRFSSLGWGTIYAFLLHFTLILNHPNISVKKRCLRFLLYIPALVVVYFFFFSPHAIDNYDIVYTFYGFTDPGTSLMESASFPITFFHIYYISYMLIIIVSLWIFSKKTTDVSKRFQSKILLYSYMLTVIVGSVLDQAILWQPDPLVPRFAVIVALLPMFTIFYIIKTHRFLLPKNLSTCDTEHLLNDVNKIRLYEYAASFFLLLGFISFGTQYFVQRFLMNPQLIFSGTMLLFGCTLACFQKITLKSQLRDTLSALVVAIAIPFVTLHFSRYNSITIGAFPLAILLVSIIFDHRWIIVMIGISSLLTHLFMTLSISAKNIFIDSTDYIIRGVFLFIMMLLTLHIRKIFAEKLVENEKQMQFQKSIASLSSRFFAHSSEDVNHKINQLLSIAGNYFQSDRVYIFWYSPDKATMTQTYEWCADGVEPTIDFIVTIETIDIPWWTQRILNDDFLYIPNIDLMPEEASVEKEVLSSQGIKSLICIPTVDKVGVTGFVGLDSVHVLTEWSENHRNMLKIVSNLISDAFEKMESEKSIYTMAYHDQLTSLPNRFYLDEKLEAQIRLAQESSSIIALLFLDIDSFKYINETIGHMNGDLLLIEVAKRLTFQLPSESDTLIRFGSDEFIIMLASPRSSEEVEQVAQRIIEAFRQPIFLGNQNFFVSVSIGISIYPIDGIEPSTLIKNADVTMYESKRLGKNQYNFCSSSIKEIVSEKIRLTNYLHRALEKDELMLYYQPLISASTGKIKGFEALLRWRQESIGMVSPALFIPIAEQTGLIHPIGKWVLMSACKQAQKWRHEFGVDFEIAVNLSMKQFKDSHLIDTVKEALTCGLPAHLLELEITESEEIETEMFILNMLYALKNLNVRIAIDDFGTKYSSLSRLKVLPIDKIKIDMQFIHGITVDPKNQSITKSIIDLSKNLSLTVLAEGVESKDQLDFLTSHGCDEIQGYYFYRPMSADDIEALLKKS